MGLFGKIKDVVKSASTVVYDAQKDVIQSVQDGIEHVAVESQDEANKVAVEAQKIIEDAHLLADQIILEATSKINELKRSILHTALMSLIDRLKSGSFAMKITAMILEINMKKIEQIIETMI